MVRRARRAEPHRGLPPARRPAPAGPSLPRCWPPCVEVVVGVGDLDMAWWQNVPRRRRGLRSCSASCRWCRGAGRRDLAAIVRRARAAGRVRDRRCSWCCLRCSRPRSAGSRRRRLAFAAANVVLLVGSSTRPPASASCRCSGGPAGKAARELGRGRPPPGPGPAAAAAHPDRAVHQHRDVAGGRRLRRAHPRGRRRHVHGHRRGLPRHPAAGRARRAGHLRAATRRSSRSWPARPRRRLAPEYVDDLGRSRDPAVARRQRLNVSLVALFSQGLQITLVTLLVGAVLRRVRRCSTITPDDHGDLARPPGRRAAGSFGVLGHDLRVTAELLKISGFLGRVLRPVLHGGARDRRDLPQRVPQGDPRRAAPDLRRAPRVPAGARGAETA